MTPPIDVRIATDPDEQATIATQIVVDAIQSAPGDFALVLSGGSTPSRFHRRLASVSPDALPWGRVSVFFSDERAVAADAPDSNYRVAHETLLATAPFDPARVHRIPGEGSDLDAVARDYERVIRSRTRGTGELDLVILGMGSDGHTASLFPGHPEPAIGSLVTATPVSPTPPHTRRITMTYATLAMAHHVLVLVSGSDKAERLADILSTPSGLPLRRVLDSRTRPTTLLADTASAALLAPHNEEWRLP